MIHHPDTEARGELLHEALTEQIMGAAIEVDRALGPGLLESAYEECLRSRSTIAYLPKADRKARRPDHHLQPRNSSSRWYRQKDCMKQFGFLRASVSPW